MSKIKKTNFNLRTLIEDIINELTNSFFKRGQQVDLTFDCEEEFYSDPKIIKNIIINLLSNASKYSEQNDVISLKVNSSEDCLEIYIKDQGIGIPLEEQKYLFQRFFRAENAMNIKGTGLGLNIVRKYTELLKGTIELVSSSSDGTVFKLTLEKVNL